MTKVSCLVAKSLSNKMGKAAVNAGGLRRQPKSLAVSVWLLLLLLQPVHSVLCAGGGSKNALLFFFSRACFSWKGEGGKKQQPGGHCLINRLMGLDGL